MQTQRTQSSLAASLIILAIAIVVAGMFVGQGIRDAQVSQQQAQAAQAEAQDRRTAELIAQQRQQQQDSYAQAMALQQQQQHMESMAALRQQVSNYTALPR
jgi:hypothetical protein